MSKEILLVYQDCPDCGVNPSFSKKQKEIARKYGFSIKYMSFNEIGAKGLIRDAVTRGINRMPFYTDNKRFTYDLTDFVEEKQLEKHIPTSERVKQAVRKKRGVVNGNNEDPAGQS